MKIIGKSILAAGAIALLMPLAAVQPAAARTNVGISFDFGNVAVGYRDGYWDHGHRWHRWNERERIAYRSRYRDHYYDGYHSHYRDHGWR